MRAEVRKKAAGFSDNGKAGIRQVTPMAVGQLQIAAPSHVVVAPSHVVAAPSQKVETQSCEVAAPL